MTLPRIAKYTLYVLFAFLIILYLCFKFSFQNGFSIIIDNRSDKTITSDFIYKAGNGSTGSQRIHFEEQQPNTTVKAWTSFPYTDAVGIEYKDNSGILRIVPLAYVYNSEATNIALLIIYQIDENGVITEYESFNKSDDMLTIIWYAVMDFIRAV